ncbi:MAG TPA: LacI family DNA-binding transcriptional regulator [Gaiellaceae bacterium]|nr:LacI family DNA-binding transcriptional regulator [Gaiellaceae bacterium]
MGKAVERCRSDLIAAMKPVTHRRNMATLRDVARRAGVSVATASRVATGALPVRPETRERVERAMRELLYVPPARRAETGLIGVLVPELGNPIFPALAQAIETRAAPDGLASILCNTGEAAFREVDYVHMLLERGVQGMIFIACEMTNLRGDHGHYAKLVEEGARLVFVNGALHTLDVPSVGVDERAAGEIATQHLIELGHERIGFVGGLEHYLPTQLKGAGRETALASAGLDPDGVVAYEAFSVDGGRRAIAKLLSRPEPPTGVICSSDLMAIGALHEARRRGLRVPEDLSIVGFDGIEATCWTEPMLTTVEQPIAEIADTAVETLQALIADSERPVPNSYFRPVVRARGSSAPPARARPPRAAATS